MVWVEERVAHRTGQVHGGSVPDVGDETPAGAPLDSAPQGILGKPDDGHRCEHEKKKEPETDLDRSPDAHQKRKKEEDHKEYDHRLFTFGRVFRVFPRFERPLTHILAEASRLDQLHRLVPNRRERAEGST